MSSVISHEYCTHQIRKVNRDARTIDIIASDFSLDSFNTRLDPNGWDVEQFKKNPIILAHHNDRSFPVANAIPETVRADNGKLIMRIRFPEQGTYPDADIAYELYADGFMRGVSVGFLPLTWEDTEEINDSGEMIPVRIFRSQKLLEVSLVSIPSNDNAMAVRAAQLGADVDDVRERTRRLEQMTRKTPSATLASDSPTSMPTITRKSAQKETDAKKDMKDGEDTGTDPKKQVKKSHNNVQDAGSHNNVEDSRDGDMKTCEHGKPLTECDLCYGKKSMSDNFGNDADESDLPHHDPNTHMETKSGVNGDQGDDNTAENVEDDDNGQMDDEIGADEEIANKKNKKVEKDPDNGDGDMMKKGVDEYVIKCITYYERKQPWNRMATKVLQRFFKVHNEDVPKNEIEAWERMLTLLDTPAQTPEEAPRSVQKASERVYLLSEFLEERQARLNKLRKAAEEALRQGKPLSKLAEILSAQ